MKANELRIGNLVLFENEIQEISSIHSDNTVRLRKNKNEKCHGCYTINSEKIKPILLTDEWLIKLGFISDGIEWWNGFICLGIFKHGIHYLPTEEINYLVGQEFKYVHQLQNLIFVITGEDYPFEL